MSSADGGYLYLAAVCIHGSEGLFLSVVVHCSFKLVRLMTFLSLSHVVTVSFTLSTCCSTNIASIISHIYAVQQKMKN